ncbi:hypothetical protein ABZ863_19875 [Saccharomonospora sp. NPDC046836]|uniref:hypothetical protein n=1 Tax=Saccharomonospora sp. NPDC046836 TaxID=3156921 RepID=UPI00341154FD
MARDWAWDALHAEVSYRVEELRKAGRGNRPGRERRWSRGLRRQVTVPHQRTGAHDSDPVRSLRRTR